MADTNNDYLLQEFNSRLAEELIVNDVILVLYLILGTIGNCCVIYIYVFKMRKNLDDRYFIPFLAVSDLFACILGCICALVVNLLPVRYPSDALCKLLWSSAQTGFICTGLLTLSIAFQRYLKVCHLGRKINIVWRRVILLGVVLTSIIISAPDLWFYELIPVRDTLTNVTGQRCGCNENDDAVLWNPVDQYHTFALVLGVVVILAIILLYSLIIRRIYLQSIVHKKQTLELTNRETTYGKNTLKYKSIRGESEPSTTALRPNDCQEAIGNVSCEPNLSKRFEKLETKTHEKLLSEPQTNAKQNTEIIRKKSNHDNVRLNQNAGNISVEMRPNRGNINALRCDHNSGNGKIAASSTSSIKPRKSRKSLRDVLLRKLNIPITEDSDSVISSRDFSSVDQVDDGQMSISNTLKRKERRKTTMEKLSRRYTFTFMAISLFYVLSYIPTLTLIYVHGADSTKFWVELSVSMKSGLLFVRRFHLLNHVLNPIIYAVFDSRFRNELKQLRFCKYCLER